MKSFLILILIFSFTAKADTPHQLPETDTEVYTRVDKLPSRLLKLHETSFIEAQCTDDLDKQLISENAFRWKVDEYTWFYAIPCARWGHNQSWKMYVEFNEPQADGKGLFKHLLFPVLDWNRNLTASDVVHDWIWENNTATIKSVFLRDGRTDCGAQYSYFWDSGTQKFNLKSGHFKSKCDGQNTPWPEIVLPK